jgi:aspartyl-tRNA(Asn)/glutamyl-tRNA(Gln) amidotransferase subunit A
VTFPEGATIRQLAAEIAAGRVSCAELTEACLERIAGPDAALNAFITVLSDRARVQARALDEELRVRGPRGPLHGIPISLKDLIDVEDVPTTGGSRLLAGHVARADAPVVAALRRAGCVFLGKCNLHEVAFGTTSEDSAYGPVRNPWDLARSAGGSSGGSAAATVRGLGYASVGTDTGGSIRIPAAACGCVGLKPTYGEVSCDGVIPLSRSLDHVGPLARSMADARLLYEALLGATTGLRAPGSRMLTLGLLRPYFTDILDEGVRSALDAAVDRLRQAGASVHERAIPHARDIATIYLHLQLPEASAYHAAALERTPDAYTLPVKLRLQMGRYVQAEDYVRARQGADLLRAEVDGALEGCDALVLPTLPIVAQPIGTDSMTIDGAAYPVRGLMLRLTQLFDITGHPAVSVPCGRRGGLPVGLQLVGRLHHTPALLDVAEQVEDTLSR